MDRDGVINHENSKVKSLKNFKIQPKIQKAIKKLNKNKIPCFIVTNQAGLAKGEFNLNELSKIISRLDNNISNLGTENKLVIDIHNASITRNDINMEVNVAGIIKKQDEYLYELNLEVLFILYNE